MFSKKDLPSTRPGYVYKRPLLQAGNAQQNSLDMKLIIRELYGYVTDLSRMEMRGCKLAKKFALPIPEQYFTKIAPYITALH